MVQYHPKGKDRGEWPPCEHVSLLLAVSSCTYCAVSEAMLATMRVNNVWEAVGWFRARTDKWSCSLDELLQISTELSSTEPLSVCKTQIDIQTNKQIKHLYIHIH